MSTSARAPNIKDCLHPAQSVLGEVGANMMKGAYEAEKALHNIIPDSVPKPVTWGTVGSRCIDQYRG